MSKKKNSKIEILKAVDTISRLADLDVEQSKSAEHWFNPDRMEENQETIQKTFQMINAYLHNLYQKDRHKLREPEVEKGVRSMIRLAGEAAEQVNRYTDLFQGAHAPDETLSEFRKLQKFYFSKVFSQGGKPPAEEEWELEGKEEAPGVSGDKRQPLHDLEAVRQDEHYELFYMTHEDGTAFFTPGLLRHLRMVGNFDETLTPDQQEDMLFRVEVCLDRDLHISAQKVLQDCQDLAALFYKEVWHHKDHDTLMHVSKAVMALMLAANPKNLLLNTTGKSCVDYWNDFVYYLRLSFKTEGYLKWNQGEQTFKLAQVCLQLMHRLSDGLFLRAPATDEELKMLHTFMGKTLGVADTIWQSLKSARHALFKELQDYPSGPLMKVLKMFRRGEEKKGFDPLLQRNAPMQIFNIASEDLHTTVIHLPPTVHQKTLEKGEITAEFKGYLRSLGERKHLYVNLQDHTQEGVQCTLLENLSQEKEFSQTFRLITLPKTTDFYHQIHQYRAISEAKEFCKICIEQIKGGGKNGFYFSKEAKIQETIDPLVKFVHVQFFEEKESLSHRERVDFIEILYFFITLRYFDEEKPDVMNFSCKDGVDVGATTTASFYGFTRMLSSSDGWTDHDRDFFLSTLFIPAFFVRHRVVHEYPFERAISALEHFEKVIVKSREAVLKGSAKMLPEAALQHLKIVDIA